MLIEQISVSGGEMGMIREMVGAPLPTYPPKPEGITEEFFVWETQCNRIHEADNALLDARLENDEDFRRRFDEATARVVRARYATEDLLKGLRRAD